MRLDQVTQLRKSCQSRTQRSHRSILAYEAIQVILQPYQIGVEQGLDGLIEALVGHRVDVSVLIIEKAEIGLDREGHHFAVLFALPDTRGYNVFIDQV